MPLNLVLLKDDLLESFVLVLHSLDYTIKLLFSLVNSWEVSMDATERPSNDAFMLQFFIITDQLCHVVEITPRFLLA